MRWIFCEFSDVFFEECSNGYDAIKECEIINPDLVFLDYNMDGINGVDTAKKILNMNKNCKIIMVSSMKANYIKEEAIQSGVSFFLTKPYKKEELIYLIKKIIN